MKIQWVDWTCESAEVECTYAPIEESRICTPEEITQTQYDNGNLYLCPPNNDALHLNNNFEFYPSTGISLQISPNYESFPDKKSA